MHLLGGVAVPGRLSSGGHGGPLHQYFSFVPKLCLGTHLDGKLGLPETGWPEAESGKTGALPENWVPKLELGNQNLKRKTDH